MFPVNRLLCALASALLVSAPVLAQSPAKARPNNAAKAAPVFTYDQSEAAMAFATDLAVRRNLDPAWVRQQIGQAQRMPKVIRLMQPAPTRHAQKLGRLPRPLHRTHSPARRATILGRQPRNTGPRRDRNTACPPASSWA